MTAFAIPSNLAFDNYADLIAAIADWMNRTDLSGSVQSMVGLCDARLRRELQPLMTETTGTVTVVDGVGTLPADCDIIRLVEYDGGRLQQVSPAFGRQYPEDDAPRGFSLEAGQLRMWPITNGTLTLVYQPKHLSLSEADPTNELLSEHPDLYFFGSMMFAEGYVANDGRASMFKSLFDEALAEVKRFLGRQRYVGIRLNSPSVVV